MKKQIHRFLASCSCIELTIKPVMHIIIIVEECLWMHCIYTYPCAILYADTYAPAVYIPLFW